MKSIIETGGKQYNVEVGSEIYIEKLEANAKDEVVFDKVIMANGIYGKPYVDNAKVIGEVVKQGKQRKIVVFKYKPKKSHHKKQGHRQPYTKVLITKIEA